MPETLVVPLGGDGPNVSAAVERALDVTDPVVFPLSRLTNGGRKILRERRFDRLAVVGAPPDDEIGYAFAAVVACVARPRNVALVDVRREQSVARSLRRYLAETAPFVAAQVVTSGLALGLQRVAIPLASSPRRLSGSPALTRLVYLRPAVGSTTGVGGSVTHTHEVIRALARAGVEVEPFTTDANIAEAADTEPDPPCAWRVARTPRATKAIPASAAAGGDAVLVRAALAAARSADAIYQRHERFSLSGALLARLSGRPLILEYNGSQVYMGKYWSPTPLRSRLARCEDVVLRAAALVVVVSEPDRQSLLERGLEPERILLSRNAVDASRFATGGGLAVRERSGLADDDVVVGFVGTFGSWHGAPVLARAFVDVAASVSNARLLLVGEGPELTQTLGLLSDAGLADRIMSTGAVSPSDVADYLDACDVLASPHVPLAGGVEFFGSPTKLFEYMAAGKAIVASRLGQIGETLEDGETALLVTPGDAEELAAAVKRLATAPELRSKLGANARRRAIEQHSWDDNVQRLLDAYPRLRTEATA